jgi:hypothetical protein
MMGEGGKAGKREGGPFEETHDPKRGVQSPTPQSAHASGWIKKLELLACTLHCALHRVPLDDPTGSA